MVRSYTHFLYVLMVSTNENNTLHNLRPFQEIRLPLLGGSKLPNMKKVGFCPCYKISVVGAVDLLYQLLTLIQCLYVKFGHIT